MQIKLEQANSQLARCMPRCRRLKEKLAILTAQLAEATSTKEMAEATVAKEMSKLDMANRLINALSSENIRWNQGGE